MIMLSKLSLFWLAMAGTTVAIVSYFIALMIDNVFGKDGFGTIGNMIVLTAGFFLGLIVWEYFGYRTRDLQVATFVGIGSALATFTVLALLKLLLDKIR